MAMAPGRGLREDQRGPALTLAGIVKGIEIDTRSVGYRCRWHSKNLTKSMHV